METRDNGLQASAYTSLGEVAPDTWRQALEALRSVGVAAYVVGDVEGHLVLWVDSTASARARQTLEPDPPGDTHPDQVPPPGADDTHGAADAADTADTADAEWDALVAAFDAPAAGESRPWPAAEDVEEDSEPGAGETGTPRAVQHSEPPQAEPPQAEPPGAEPPYVESSHPDNDDEHHFIPPTPPPLPRGDALTRWSWAALLGTPVFLFAATLFGVDLPEELILLVVAGFVAGFVTLVVRMKDRPPSDSGPDDGAVV
ncbi:MAG: hypothetical protein ACRDYU_18905 [Actinomycetes bacterium]